MAANRISRVRVIEGLATPAFIHNGPSYFSINLQVFADGLVECWDLLDLALFRQKLRSGWVVPGVPAGGELSVHHLASWTIDDPLWQLDAEGLDARVESLVRELNPLMENLYDCHGRTTQKIGGANVSIFGMVRERPLRLVGEGWGAQRVHGERMSTLIHDGDYHLASLRIFSDSVVEIGGIPTPETTDLAGLRAAVEAGRVVGSVPQGGRIHLHGLGSFRVAREHWSVDPREQLREVEDRVAELNGKPDSVQRCRDAYDAYLADPSAPHREALRLAYESVPEHTRMYVGDMDTKDIAVRMIIYGDQEIEGWSHRAVARSQGIEPLPEIKVPRPKGGDGV